jgi:hypothetical protein
MVAETPSRRATPARTAGDREKKRRAATHSRSHAGKISRSLADDDVQMASAAPATPASGSSSGSSSGSKYALGAVLLIGAVVAVVVVRGGATTPPPASGGGGDAPAVVVDPKAPETKAPETTPGPPSTWADIWNSITSVFSTPLAQLAAGGAALLVLILLLLFIRYSWRRRKARQAEEKGVKKTTKQAAKAALVVARNAFLSPFRALAKRNGPTAAFDLDADSDAGKGFRQRLVDGIAEAVDRDTLAKKAGKAGKNIKNFVSTVQDEARKLAKRHGTNNEFMTRLNALLNSNEVTREIDVVPAKKGWGRGR